MKKKFRILLLFLIALISASTLTGCGTIEIDTSMEKEEYTGGSGPGFMSVYKDAIVINGKEGAVQKGEIKPSDSVTGLVEVKNNVPRQVAKMMAKTVLGSAPAADQFDGKGGDSWGTISFSPGTILQKTNEATIAAVTGNGAMQQVYNALRKVAMGVLFVVWFMGFVSSAAGEQITMETALKSLLQLVCGMLIVLNSHIFAQAFAQLGNVAIGSSIGAVGAGFSSLIKKVNEFMSSINYLGIGVNIGVITKGFFCLWWDSGSLFVIGLLAYPFYQAIRAAYKIVSIMISRYFELIFGVAVAPIALALSAQRGFDHGVIMYLRKITAAALQPFLIVIAVMSFESLTDMVLSIFGNASAGGLGVIPAVVAVSCSYMVFSAFVGETKHIAKEFIAH